MISTFGLTKKERISGKTEIDRLFETGSSFIAYPLRVVFIAASSEENQDKNQSPVSIMVSVSKRKFKRAVKRNRIKRLIKEAYRLNKYTLLNTIQDKKLSVAFLYLSNEEKDYKEIETSMQKALNTLSKTLNKEVSHEEITD